MLEQGLAENIFVDYKRKGSHYECITMGAIKEISSKVCKNICNQVIIKIVANLSLELSIVLRSLPEIVLYSGREHEWHRTSAESSNVPHCSSRQIQES
jgi:hypothetical protein